MGSVKVFGEEEILPENCNWKISRCRLAQTFLEEFGVESCNNDDLYSFVFDKNLQSYSTIHIKSEQSEDYGYIYIINWWSGPYSQSEVRSAIDTGASVGPLGDYGTGVSVDKTYKGSDIQRTQSQQILVVAKKGVTPEVTVTE